MLCIVCNVLLVVYDMLVAPARLLGLGVIILRHAVVSLIWGPQYPQTEFFRSFIREGHWGFLKDISIKMIDGLKGEIGCGKASGNVGSIALPLRV